MIEIPKRIWICSMTTGESRLGPLMVSPKDCPALDNNNCCTYRGMDGKHCDAKPYEIKPVKERK